MYHTRWSELNKGAPTPGLRELARHTALSAQAILSRPKPENSLRLVYCHYVFDDQVQAFEEKIKYLKNIGTFLTTDEVMAVIRGERELSGRCFHLSFDDGFRNIISNALPVLKEHGVPSTFFVPTAIVSADEDTVRNFCFNVVNHRGMIEMASWDELAAAREFGMDIASHTRTHQRFSEMSGSDNQLTDEILGSKEELEARLGQPCPYISWPYGSIRDADATSLKAVKQAGYAACFGAFRGRIEPGRTDPYYIPRHHFEAHWPLGHLKYFAHGAHEAPTVLPADVQEANAN